MRIECRREYKHPDLIAKCLNNECVDRNDGGSHNTRMQDPLFQDSILKGIVFSVGKKPINL